MWRNLRNFSRMTIPLPRRLRFFAALLAVCATVAAVLLFVSNDGGQRAFATPVCENGTIIPNHADHPQLVVDCTVLLDLQPTLAGTATLNWSANTALTSWDGITVASLDDIRRVTELDMDGQGLNGAIPAQLGDLTGLSRLQLAWGNQLSGSIPAELGRLTRLTYLNLADNQLSGPIPSELGAIGPQLTGLILSGAQPLPQGVGLSGSIPAQLGNLSGLENLYLDGNRLAGSIPPRLGRLVNLRWLQLQRNQLSGPIPTQLGDLTQLTNLQLYDNQLTGALPTQLANLHGLRKFYVKGNSGITGCVPLYLRNIQINDLDDLNLPDCALGAPPTPETPLPTYTLTVTAGADGAVDPAGATTHTEGVPVTLTASWNDATHSFAGWSGACSGAETTCTLELYADASVTAAFTPLPAARCATPTDADCILAVYKGRPEDFAQVQDIPSELLLQPDSDGRYQVERGQQYTVVTAAPLPEGWIRFYLQRSPDQADVSPTTLMQLIPPVGTTYTFTVNSDERGANLLSFDLHAARPLPIQRPGIKPELGDVIVTTEFLVPAFRYNRLDTTGASSSPGSYAFLNTAGVATSAIGNFGHSAWGTRELRIHPVDASGASRTTFFDTVSVGDTFDYQTKWSQCGFRFSITSVSPSRIPRIFEIEMVTLYGGRCRGFVDDPEQRYDVRFVWNPGPGLEGPDGIRVMLNKESVGPGTYRLWEPVPWLLDVPAGSTITRGAVIEQSPEGDEPNPIYITVMIHYEEDGLESTLHIDPHTGKEVRRIVSSPNAAAVFDHIIQSIRPLD